MAGHCRGPCASCRWRWCRPLPPSVPPLVVTIYRHGGGDSSARQDTPTRPAPAQPRRAAGGRTPVLPLQGRRALFQGAAAPPWTPRSGEFEGFTPQTSTPPPASGEGFNPGGWGTSLEEHAAKL